MVAVKSQVILQDGEDTLRYDMPRGNAYTRAATDMQGLSVGEVSDRWVFTWQLGDVKNPWGSPIGLSLVSLDLYVAPIAGAGMPAPLLQGRDAKASRPWWRAISIEGWQQGVYKPDDTKLGDVEVAVDPLAREVRAYVPKKLIPGNPRSWAYLATLEGQDGFAPGRVRQVLPTADADHFGGRPAGQWSNLLDVILPPSFDQTPSLFPDANQPVVLPYVTPEGRVEGLE
jgi:carbohydrate-binding DOMON domain-containing protein